MTVEILKVEWLKFKRVSKTILGKLGMMIEHIPMQMVMK